MAIGRISGPMLYNNLDRQGVNLSIDGNLIYADVNNRYVGINNAAPAYALDSPGSARLANLLVIGNQISSNTGIVSLGGINNVSITGGVNYNLIYTNGSGTLAFGNLVQIVSQTNFTGNSLALGVSPHGNDAYGTNALTTGQTVSDAITTLDNILGNITNISGNVITTGNLFLTGGQPNYILSTNGAGQTYWANLQLLAGLEGFDGNNISLGSNTVGTLGNAVPLTTATTVTDSIALINQLLGNITNAGGNLLHVTGNVTAGNVNSTFYGNLFGNVSGTHYGNVVGNISGTSATFTGNVTSANINANLYGYVTAPSITSNFYGNISTDVITPYRTPLTVFNSATAIGLPKGTTSDRPATSGATAGYMRFNSDLGTVEFFTGVTWQPLTNSITDQQITPTGLTATYTLDQTATSAGIIVSINGTLQAPNIAYTVSGNQITFAETPLTTDIIDVRFIASSITVASIDATIVDTGNIAVGTGNTIVDSFPTSIYRSATYSISSTNPYDSQFADVRIVQNNGVVVVTAHAILNTGSNTVTFTANINGGAVNLIAKGTTAANQLRVEKTYFLI